MAINAMKCVHIGEMSGVVEARQTAMTVCEVQGLVQHVPVMLPSL
jgi:hypothetical protein